MIVWKKAEVLPAPSSLTFTDGDSTANHMSGLLQLSAPSDVNDVLRLLATKGAFNGEHQWQYTQRRNIQKRTETQTHPHTLTRNNIQIRCLMAKPSCYDLFPMATARLWRVLGGWQHSHGGLLSYCGLQVWARTFWAEPIFWGRLSGFVNSYKTTSCTCPHLVLLFINQSSIHFSNRTKSDKRLCWPQMIS